MSDIDPEKLEEALSRAECQLRYDRHECRADVQFGSARCAARQTDIEVICKAARAHLATLPRFKEVEVGSWVVVDAQGRVGAFLYHTDSDARDAADERGHGSQAVRLTGTAKVKVTP